MQSITRPQRKMGTFCVIIFSSILLLLYSSDVQGNERTRSRIRKDAAKMNTLEFGRLVENRRSDTQADNERFLLEDIFFFDQSLSYSHSFSYSTQAPTTMHPSEGRTSPPSPTSNPDLSPSPTPPPSSGSTADSRSIGPATASPSSDPATASPSSGTTTASPTTGEDRNNNNNNSLTTRVCDGAGEGEGSSTSTEMLISYSYSAETTDGSLDFIEPMETIILNSVASAFSCTVPQRALYGTDAADGIKRRLQLVKVDSTPQDSVANESCSPTEDAGNTCTVIEGGMSITFDSGPSEEQRELVQRTFSDGMNDGMFLAQLDSSSAIRLTLQSIDITESETSGGSSSTTNSSSEEKIQSKENFQGTPYIIGGTVALVAFGAIAFVLTRKRRSTETSNPSEEKVLDEVTSAESSDIRIAIAEHNRGCSIQSSARLNSCEDGLELHDVPLDNV